MLLRRTYLNFFRGFEYDSVADCEAMATVVYYDVVSGEAQKNRG